MRRTAAIAKQLAAPLKYLSVEGRGKLSIDAWLPLIASILSSAVLLQFDAPIATEKGLLAQVNALLQMLVGFYVASLAAISTFPNVALDQEVKNSTLAGKPITRRRLLSLLFGYLAFVSMFLYICGAMGMLIPRALHSLTVAYPWARPALIGLYTLACGNLLCVTLLGLYYLVDRQYRPDPIVKPKSDQTK